MELGRIGNGVLWISGPPIGQVGEIHLDGDMFVDVPTISKQRSAYPSAFAYTDPNHPDVDAIFAYVLHSIKTLEIGLVGGYKGHPYDTHSCPLP